MRPIKFRAWDERGKQIIEHENLIMTCGGFSAIDEEATMFPMEEIMQFTGLLDKNGREIYEGDIIIASNVSGIAVVMFEDGGFVAPLSIFLNKDMEIIGNIYETPLLK